MATFGYRGVSTKDQTAENQRLETEAAGYKVDYFFSDTLSGKTSASQRPQFMELLKKIREDEPLVVSKLDRIGRDAQDVGAVISTLKKLGIKVIVLQLGNLDLASPAGTLMLTMLSAVVEMERDLLIERTDAGLARAKAEGKTLGRIPKTTHSQHVEMKRRYAEGKGETVSALAETSNSAVLLSSQSSRLLKRLQPRSHLLTFNPTVIPLALSEPA
jgi:putative DNA-invertase from lambdoid prophage Rac